MSSTHHENSEGVQLNSFSSPEDGGGIHQKSETEFDFTTFFIEESIHDESVQGALYDSLFFCDHDQDSQVINSLPPDGDEEELVHLELKPMVRDYFCLTFPEEDQVDKQEDSPQISSRITEKGPLVKPQQNAQGQGSGDGYTLLYLESFPQLQMASDHHCPSFHSKVDEEPPDPGGQLGQIQWLKISSWTRPEHWTIKLEIEQKSQVILSMSLCGSPIQSSIGSWFGQVSHVGPSSPGRVRDVGLVEPDNSLNLLIGNAVSAASQPQGY